MEFTKKKGVPRPEYPRPQFVRKNNWINLNGEWEFAFDDCNKGLKERWYKKEASRHFDKKIIVPFCFQSKLSGIGDNSFHDIVWYCKEFDLSEDFLNNKVLLHFGAVDYYCTVYVNGAYVGNHEGGYIGFSFDITDFIEKNNVLILRIEDPSEDLEIPRGKQYWKEEAEGIFYPRVTGIWQTVWLEYLSPRYYIKNMKITPDIDDSQVFIEYEIYGKGFPDLYLLINILFNDEKIAEKEINLDFLGDLKKKRDSTLFKEKKEIFNKEFKPNPNRFKIKIPIPKHMLYLWDVNNPNLYDLMIKVYNKKTMELYDEIQSYFGMRKISLSDASAKRYDFNVQKEEIKSFNQVVLLNNKPIYQKLFLVQGYWSESLYTAPFDEAIELDIQYVKDFGFNGLRTHQKAFDPRSLYWCDKLGVLVWGEIGNAYRFSVKSQLRLINEFVSEIERDFNHPSIIVWTMLNEGWGVSGASKEPNRADYTVSLYYLMKSIDPTRIIVDDDGWWHTKTDLCTKHFYSPGELLPKSFEDEIKHQPHEVQNIYLEPYKYHNEPIIYSEIGGFGFDFYKNLKNKWGYGKIIESGDDLFNKVFDLLKCFDERKEWIHGFCYTELYDQFQEINGLLTMNREPKFEPSRLKSELDKMFY